MDAALFPHKPLYPIQSKRPPSFPLDSLLHHLVHLSSTPQHANSAAARFPSLEVSTTQKWKPMSNPVLGNDIGSDEGRLGSLKLLCKKEVVLLNSIVEQLLPRLSSFLDSAKSELLRTDLFGLVKALDDSGNWERAGLVFEWLVLASNSRALKLDHQVIEILVRILGRESQYTVAAKLFDQIPELSYSV